MKNLKKLTIRNEKFLTEKELRNLQGVTYLFQCWAYQTWIPSVELAYYDRWNLQDALDTCWLELLDGGSNGYCECQQISG